VLVPLVVPGRDAVQRRVLFQESDCLREVGEEVRRDVQVFLEDDGVLGFRIDVEDGSERGFVVLRDSGILQADWRVLNAS